MQHQATDVFFTGCTLMRETLIGLILVLPDKNIYTATQSRVNVNVILEWSSVISSQQQPGLIHLLGGLRRLSLIQLASDQIIF